MNVGDLLRPVLAGDEIADHLHRSRAVQRVHGHEVGNRGGLQLPEPVGHSGAFELKHGHGLASREQFESAGVVLRYGVQVDGHTVVLPDQPETAFKHGESAEPQEIHLEEAGAFEVLHVVLRHDLGLGCLVERDEIADVPRGDHHARGMHPGIAVHPFEDQRGIDQRPDSGIGALCDPFQVRDGFQRFGQGADLPLLNRDLLRDRLEGAERDAEHPAHVLEDGTRGERSEGDDLRHGVLTVFLPHVSYHQLPLAVGKINVDVRHAYPVRVQKPLKQEVVLDRVDIRDAERIGRHAPGRASTAWTDVHTHSARRADEILNNKEISRIAHPLYDRNFVLQPLDQRFVCSRIPAREPFPGKCLKMLVESRGPGTLRDRKLRHVVPAEFELKVAFFRHLKC